MATRNPTTACSCTDTHAGGSPNLADHAATAALYVTDPERKRADREALQAEQQAQSTLPRPGLSLASASAAASLAHANQKTTEPWKPERQPHAEKAALHARGYQSPETPPPAKVNPNVYKAALLAAKERITASSPPANAPEVHFDHAAAQAMVVGGRPARETTVAQIDPRALTAATGAVSNRRRAESAPIKPVYRHDAAYALSAATISHRARQETDDVLNVLNPAMEAARIHHIAQANVQLYTSTPPVEIEIAEQKHKDTLRAAAISMAKGMYAAAAIKEEERQMAESASAAADHRYSHRMSQSRFSWTAGDEQGAVRRPPNLHEAAQKIATEKLAKMQQSDLTNQQHYYGTGSSVRSRGPLTRRLRRRTSSDGDTSRVDWERSEQIRHQMSSLQSRLHNIDEKKSRDRAELMEIAQRNVNAAIHDMDEKVYARTGKPSPHMQREWEERAQEKAQTESDARMANYGRISLGGQKYVDEADVEAIARSRIQPTLDEITDRVEEQKAREVEQRLDEERRHQLYETERQRELDLRGEERRHEAETSQAAKETKYTPGLWARTSRVLRGRKRSDGTGPPIDDIDGDARPQPNVSNPGAETTDSGAHHDRPRERVTEENTAVQPLSSPPLETDDDRVHAVPASRDDEGEVVVTGAGEPITSPTPAIEISPMTSPKSESKLRSWFKTRVGRRLSKPPLPSEPAFPEPERERTPGGFRGGSALTGATPDSPRGAPLRSNPVTEGDLATTNSSVPSEHQEAMRQWSTSTAGSGDEDRRWSGPSEHGSRRNRLRMSLKDMISRKTTSEPGSAGVSPLASPTSPTASKNVGSAAAARPKTSRANTMERDELRDSFTEESLPPPPNLFSAGPRRSVSSSVRDSKFSEDL